MRARFHRPVYDGHRADIEPVGDGGLELRDEDGELCAEGAASLPPAAAPIPDPADWADVDQVADPPPAAPETLVPGTAFGLAPHGFHAARHREYLDDVRESDQLYVTEGVAHPGWILRDANYVLSANVRLGPWIHVESVVQHHDVVRDGEEVTARRARHQRVGAQGPPLRRARRPPPRQPPPGGADPAHRDLQATRDVTAEGQGRDEAPPCRHRLHAC